MYAPYVPPQPKVEETRNEEAGYTRYHGFGQVAVSKYPLSFHEPLPNGYIPLRSFRLPKQ